MKVLRHLLLLAVLAPAGLQAAPPVSHFPQRELGQFLADSFDLATIRSSFGPRRTPTMRTFSDFGLSPSKAGDDVVEFDTETWFYQLRITRRADLNQDGTEDLDVCFTDRAKNGTYESRKAFIISRYASEGYAVAIAYESDACGAGVKAKKR